MLNSLLKALNISNSVTLPSFGGIMKMGSSYMFNEFLKFNDGKFSKFLQETKGLSEEAANVKIDDFINEIKTSLEAKGSFSLNEIGTLIQKDGKVKLEKNASLPDKKETKATPVKSEDKPASLPIEKEKVQVKEVKKKDIVIEKPKEKEVKKVATKLSADFTVKEAQEKIMSFNDKQEIFDFTKGDKRKTIIEALNQRLKSLNKIDASELDILEATKTNTDKDKEEKITPIKEGTEKEVKKQVANESDILKTVVEKEIADKQEEIKEIPPVQKEEKKKVIATPLAKKKEVVKTATKEEEDLVALTKGALKLEKEAKGRKRNKIIFWIALICILSGGGIVGYLKQDIVLGWFESSDQLAQSESSDNEDDSNMDEDNASNQERTKTQPIVEEIIEEEINPGEVESFEDNNQPLDAEEEEEPVKEEKVKIEPEEEVRVETANKGSYYVVVGSFSKEKNALNLVKSLKKDGHNNATIIQNGNLKSVSLGIYSSSNEAKEALKQSGKDGWVKKPR